MLIAHVIRDKGGAVYTLPADASLMEAAAALNQKRVGAVVVTDEGDTPVGVFSERDMIREIAEHGAASLSRKVGECMSRHIVTAEPAESVDAGLARMTDRRIRHLPVVDAGRLVGIVSIGDLVKMRISEVEAEVTSMRAYIATG
jgi:CBS domain-containing protein